MPQASGQGLVVLGFGSAVPAGTVVQLVSPDGDVVASFTTSRSTRAVTVTSSAIVAGTTYDVVADNSRRRRRRRVHDSRRRSGGDDPRHGHRVRGLTAG